MKKSELQQIIREEVRKSLKENATIDLSVISDALLLQMIDILNKSSVDFKDPKNQKAMMSLVKEKQKRGL